MQTSRFTYTNSSVTYDGYYKKKKKKEEINCEHAFFGCVSTCLLAGSATSETFVSLGKKMTSHIKAGTLKCLCMSTIKLRCGDISI